MDLRKWSMEIVRNTERVYCSLKRSLSSNRGLVALMQTAIPTKNKREEIEKGTGRILERHKNLEVKKALDIDRVKFVMVIMEFGDATHSKP